MTVADNYTPLVYIGTDSTTEFPFTWEINSAEELVVTHLDTTTDTFTVLDDSEYSIVGTLPGTGSVTYNPGGVPIPATEKLILERSTEAAQSMNIQNASGFLPDVLEAQLDSMTRHMQETDDRVSRSLYSRVASGVTDFLLPAAVAGLVLGWNASETALENKTMIAGAETLPAVASTVLFRNAANTAFDTLPVGTSGAAIPLLNGVNTWSGNQTISGGGWTGSYTAEPLAVTDTWFGSTHRAVHRFHSESTGIVNQLLSHSTVSIVRKWIGNDEATGGGLKYDSALFIDCRHSDYLTNDNYGQTIGVYLTIIAGRKDNHSCQQVGAAKIFDGSYDGSVSAYEFRTYMMDDTGATFKRGAGLIGWAMSDVGTNFSPMNITIWTAETDIGDLFCGFATIDQGSGSFEHVIAASTSRNNAGIYFSVTGYAHANDGGLVRATAHATTPIALPTYSWINDTDSGLTRVTGNQIALVTSAVARITIDSAGCDFGVNIKRNGTQVVGAQLAAVADATDAATAISQLNLLLARIRGHGLIAT